MHLSRSKVGIVAEFLKNWPNGIQVEPWPRCLQIRHKKNEENLPFQLTIPFVMRIFL